MTRTQSRRTAAWRAHLRWRRREMLRVCTRRFEEFFGKQFDEQLSRAASGGYALDLRTNAAGEFEVTAIPLAELRLPTAIVRLVTYGALKPSKWEFGKPSRPRDPLSVRELVCFQDVNPIPQVFEVEEGAYRLVGIARYADRVETRYERYL